MAKRYEGTLGLSPESFFGAACSDERLEVPMPDRESEDLGGTARVSRSGRVFFLVGEDVLDQACTAIESRMRRLRRRASAAY